MHGGGGLPDLGDLLLIIALFFAGMIVLSGCAERRRESEQERRMLDAIEREYEAFFVSGTGYEVPKF